MKKLYSDTYSVLCLLFKASIVAMIIATVTLPFFSKLPAKDAFGYFVIANLCALVIGALGRLAILLGKLVNDSSVTSILKNPLVLLALISGGLLITLCAALVMVGIRDIPFFVPEPTLY